MNKKQAESYFQIKLRNSWLKEARLPIRAIVEKNLHGDYELKTEDNTGNLPERISLKKQYRDLMDFRFSELRKEQIAEFLKD